MITTLVLTDPTFMGGSCIEQIELVVTSLITLPTVLFMNNRKVLFIYSCCTTAVNHYFRYSTLKTFKSLRRLDLTQRLTAAVFLKFKQNLTQAFRPFKSHMQQNRRTHQIRHQIVQALITETKPKTYTTKLAWNSIEVMIFGG